MIFLSTSDPEFNSSPPSGYYSSSGWQWQGKYGHGTGTVVSPNQVLTAKHFAKEDIFILGEKVYRVVKILDDKHSDLRLITLDMSEYGAFVSWAPLYIGNSEKGSEIVVYGRGFGRGKEVIVDNRLRGWRYAADASGTLHWGTNHVAGYVPYQGTENLLLRAEFDLSNVPTECQLANWDSGGGVFLRDGGQWKLAGVNYAVDSHFGTVTGNAGTFRAALFDVRGMTQGGAVVPVEQAQIASSFYATRISRRLDWIVPNLNIGSQKTKHPRSDARNALIIFAVASVIIIVWGKMKSGNPSQ